MVLAFFAPAFAFFALSRLRALLDPTRPKRKKARVYTQVLFNNEVAGEGFDTTECVSQVQFCYREAR